jgi:hypothetical protein
MGEQSDRSAAWKQVVWLRWSLPQNERTVAAGRVPLAIAMATGALTRRVIRADTQQAPSAKRSSYCLPFVCGGDLCVENTGGWIYGRAHDIATDNGTPMACCQRVEALLSFGL